MSLVDEPSPATMMGRGSDRNVSALLPQLARDAWTPEINSLALGPDGRLVVRDPPARLTLTFRHAGRRVTARFVRGRRDDDPVTLEIVCRVARVAPATRDGGGRRGVARRAAARAGLRPGCLSVTANRWLHLRDSFAFAPGPLTSTWVVTRIVVAMLALQPALDRLDAGGEDAALGEDAPAC